MLKTEGFALGFQHFPADIKSDTILLVPFLNKISLSENKYESISVRLHSAAYYLPPTCVCHSDTKPMASRCFGSIPGYCRQEV